MMNAQNNSRKRIFSLLTSKFIQINLNEKKYYTLSVSIYCFDPHFSIGQLQ